MTEYEEQMRELAQQLVDAQTQQEIEMIDRKLAVLKRYAQQ